MTQQWKWRHPESSTHKPLPQDKPKCYRSAARRAWSSAASHAQWLSEGTASTLGSAAANPVCGPQCEHAVARAGGRRSRGEPSEIRPVIAPAIHSNTRVRQRASPHKHRRRMRRRTQTRALCARTGSTSPGRKMGTRHRASGTRRSRARRRSGESDSAKATCDMELSRNAHSPIRMYRSGHAERCAGRAYRGAPPSSRARPLQTPQSRRTRPAPPTLAPPTSPQGRASHWPSRRQRAPPARRATSDPCWRPATGARICNAPEAVVEPVQLRCSLFDERHEDGRMQPHCRRSATGPQG